MGASSLIHFCPLYTSSRMTCHLFITVNKKLYEVMKNTTALDSSCGKDKDILLLLHQARVFQLEQSVEMAHLWQDAKILC